VFGELLVQLEHAMGLLQISVIKDLTVSGTQIKLEVNALPLLLAHHSQEILILFVKFIITRREQPVLGLQELLVLSQPLPNQLLARP
jgi:hypothetical protein